MADDLRTGIVQTILKRDTAFAENYVKGKRKRGESFATWEKWALQKKGVDVPATPTPGTIDSNPILKKGKGKLVY